MTIDSRRILFKVFAYLSLCVALAITLFPIYTLIITSLKTPGEVSSFPPTWYPHNPTLSSFTRLWTRGEFVRYFFNSLIVALTASCLSLIVAIPGGYSLARFKYPGRELLSSTVLLVYMFPPVLLVIPLFLVFDFLNLVDTYASLIISYTTFALPFCIWMLRGFFSTIPKDLEDAARIDGCNHFEAIFRIVIPLSAPGIATAFLFSFILAWSNYIYALVFINSNSKFPLTVGVQMLVGRYGMDYSLIMAGCLALILPPVIIFFLFQRYIVKGLTAGAVKE